MDAIFEQNRGALQSRFESVRQAEMQMEELARSDAPDEAALFAQIDRVAQARAELEKANTHLLLLIRRGDGCGADQAAGEDALRGRVKRWGVDSFRAVFPGARSFAL